MCTTLGGKSNPSAKTGFPGAARRIMKTFVSETPQSVRYLSHHFPWKEVRDDGEAAAQSVNRQRHEDGVIQKCKTAIRF